MQAHMNGVWFLIIHCLLISIIQLELIKSEKKKKKKHEMNINRLSVHECKHTCEINSHLFCPYQRKLLPRKWYENKLTNMWKSSHTGQKLFSLLFDLKAKMTLSKAFYAIIAIALSLSMPLIRASKEELCIIL